MQMRGFKEKQLMHGLCCIFFSKLNYLKIVLKYIANYFSSSLLLAFSIIKKIQPTLFIRWQSYKCTFIKTFSESNESRLREKLMHLGMPPIQM